MQFLGYPVFVLSKCTVVVFHPVICSKVFMESKVVSSTDFMKIDAAMVREGKWFKGGLGRFTCTGCNRGFAKDFELVLCRDRVPSLFTTMRQSSVNVIIQSCCRI